MPESARDRGLASWLARRASFDPERVAMTFGERSWTYAELQHEVEAFAAALVRLGVRPGDRVAFLDLNHPNYLLTLFATARLGAIFVPLNFRLTAPELQFALADSGACVLVYAEPFAEAVEQIRDEIPCRAFVRTPDDEAGELATALVESGPPQEERFVDRDDVALIMYTSGTTGRPKGAMITHDNLLASIHGFSLTFDTRADDRTLVVAPLFHIGGLNVTTLSAFLNGATVVLERRFDPDRVLRLLEERRITTMFAVPTMLVEMARRPGFATADLDALRLIVSGGAPVPVPLLEQYLARGIDVCAGYGMTEAAPLITIVPPGRVLDKVGSVGLPSFFTEVTLVDDQGREVPTGTPGEFLVRGPNVMKGYWNRPDATAATLADGWLRTGDVGVRDEDGFYTVVDRKKDMIITGGENVYPAEVEACLVEHERIADAAVFGVPEPTWGEAVVAVVVARDDAALTEEDVTAFMADRLARYKQPRRIVLVDELPRSPSGKVVKGELRTRYADLALRR
ncbi:long-chain-fatty-acid--CoA ligase [Conexibacter arvalis]|uniref:2-succinylbenzoate--CoA ligase n=1 Tax=Conexibacter arvalis TaxID=912552 RepID=A0A840I839_9ACTN|nr:fatty-acyl-CoA synthase [Conexibacter arvalis]